MFDYHLHSKVSFDSVCSPDEIVRAAETAGLREICFTDHYDFNDDPAKHHDIFTLDSYSDAYDGISSETVKIRRGVELGLTPWNHSEAKGLLSSRDFDFVIGSVHFAGGTDPYYPEYWQGKSAEEAFEKYLMQTLECVKTHKDYDVLGHLNYVCKSAHNPTHAPLLYEEYSEICDEIMRTVAEAGKGMEINTSGVDRVGDFLPSRDFIKRFRELGGEIITVGSDAHDGSRVGQHIDGALEIARDIFGYVCTFEGRKPIYHKI